MVIVDGVTLAATSILAVQQNSSLHVNGTLNINSAATFDGGSVLVDRQGSVNWQSGTITSKNNASFINNGVFTNQGGTAWNGQDTASFSNNGLFIEDNPEPTALNIIFKLTTNFNAPFNVNNNVFNPGTAWIEQGTLQLADDSPWPFMPDCGQSTGGTFQVDANATLEFKAGNYQLDRASTVQGDGTVLFSGGGWIDSGAYSVGTTNITGGFVMFGPDAPVPPPAPQLPQVQASTNNLSLTGGNLNGWGKLTVYNNFTWTEGTVLSYDPRPNRNGPGQMFTIDSFGSLTLQGDPAGFLYDGQARMQVGYNCTLNNHGDANWVTGSFDWVGLATVNNQGTFIAQGAGYLFGGMLGSFNNSGTFQYAPATPQDATIVPGFNNTAGAFLFVDTGTLPP